MKKTKKALIAILSTTVAAASLFALAACNTKLTDEPLKTTKIADYTKTAEDRAETFASGSKGWSWENGDPFNVWWKPNNVSYEGGKLSLSISEMTKEEREDLDCLAKYYGAEERSEHYYGYGDFQVRMKPAKVVGTASTFFTCTGPYDQWYNEDGTEVIKTNKHDEIDIEFLGMDTTRVQFNYFANGKGGHEYIYHLGFDASVEFHDYGYRWTDSYITWFVDNKPVYRIDRQGDEEWPEAPGRIIMNYWCGMEGAAGWMGTYNEDYSGKAEYEYVATGATQCPDPNTAHIKDEPVTPPDTSDVPAEGWTDISTDGFDGWGQYGVDKTDGLTITHTTAFKDYDYKCCGMDLADSYSWIKFKVKNNEDAAADARLDVKIKDTDGSGAVAAVYSESENVSLIAAESAALIHLDANEEIEVALKMKNAYVNQVVVFFNSIKADNPEAGSITITELKGIVNEDVEPEPPAPPAGATTVKIGENEVAFTGAGYTVTVSDDQSSMTVSYSGIGGHDYNNISTGITEFLGENNTFTVTIKNDGTETAKIRLDIVCDAADGAANNNGGKNDFCNIGAEYTGNVVASGNDYEWGGADWVQIAADETVTVTITFDTSIAKGVRFFIDSSTYNDDGTHSGNLVFSGMNLSKVTETSGGEESAD